MSLPLRVLHVIASMSPRHGGPTEAIVGIYPHLKSKGIEILVVSTNDDMEHRLNVPIGVETEFLRVPSIFFPNTFNRPRRLRDFAVSPSMWVWLGQNIRRFDIVHIHALFSLPTWRAMAVAHNADVPYIVRPLGVLGSWALRKAWHKKLFLNLFERSLLNKAAAIEYSSDSERDEASTHKLGAPANVIPLGFQPVPQMIEARPRFCQEHGLNESRLLIIFLSRIHAKKGLMQLLEACAGLPADSFYLIVAGAGGVSEEEAVKKRIKDFGLEASVLWLGFLTGEAKVKALSAADVFVLSSHSESFGIAVAEAMSAGCSTIITPAVPLSDFVLKNDAGWVVSPEAGEVRVALQHVLTDRQLARERGKRGAAAVVDAFSYTAIAPKLAAFYREIVARSKL